MHSKPASPIWRSLGRVGAALAIIGLTTVVWVGPAHAATPSELESCFLSKINSARASAGAGALTKDGTLSSYSRAHSTKMANNGNIYHSSSAALSPYLPAGWSSWGENVGYASDASDCGPMFQAFMNSSVHRTNLLNPAFDVAGIGVIVDDAGYMWTTHVFVDVGATTTTTTTTTVAVTTTAAPTTTTTTTTTVASTTTAATTTTTTTAAATTTSIAAGTTTVAPTTTVQTTTSTEGPDESISADVTSDGSPTDTAPATLTSPGAPPDGVEDDGADPPARLEQPLAAAIAPLPGGGTCTGFACNEGFLAVVGLVTLVGTGGGLFAYWLLRS